MASVFVRMETIYGLHFHKKNCQECEIKMSQDYFAILPFVHLSQTNFHD